MRNEAEEAIKTIEGHLMRLRGEFERMSMERGVDLGEIEDRIERQRYELERRAQEEFERLINDKNRMDQKGLIIDAYEGVLYDRRRMERDILNAKRFKEHEKNRPPEEKWYMLKNKEFSKELYRNRMALKPNDSNFVYL